MHYRICFAAYCESGYEKNGTNCTACQRGYYKDNKVDLFMACTSCGGKYVTPVGPPATIASQCIIREYLSHFVAHMQKYITEFGIYSCHLSFVVEFH